VFGALAAWAARWIQPLLPAAVGNDS